MIWRNHLVVILSAALSTIHALNLPILSNQTVELPSQLTSYWECVTKPVSKPLLYTDCEVAFRDLPNSTYQAIFHEGGEEDGHRLPVEKSHNTCTLSVSLAEGLQDKSSWAEIALKAEMLNDLCVNGANDGGYIRAGQYERIYVTLMSAEDGTMTGEVDAT